jgi:hypothetical protein
MTPETFAALLPGDRQFEAQLEGGEPTVHPAFWEILATARAHPGCRRIVVCSNGVLLPRRRDSLAGWLERCGSPLTVKLSVNHHLLEHDAGLLGLARELRELATGRGEAFQLVVNVRLRRGATDDDGAVRSAVLAADLGDVANIFFLQAYGFGAGQPGWARPRPVWDNFELYNPDGRCWDTDLEARSEAMRRLP